MCQVYRKSPLCSKLMTKGQQKLAELAELEGLLYTIFLSCKENLKSIIRPHIPPPINSLLKAK